MQGWYADTTRVKCPLRPWILPEVHRPIFVGSDPIEPCCLGRASSISNMPVPPHCTRSELFDSWELMENFDAWCGKFAALVFYGKRWPIQANVVEEGNIRSIKANICQELGASIRFGNHWDSLCIH